MPPRRHTLAAADDLAQWLRTAAGQELRNARQAAGLSMQRVADRLGWSRTKVSRIERAKNRSVSLQDLARLAATVGLRPSLRFYPTERAVRDIGQVELLAALNRRMHPRWVTRQEVPIPLPGDLRAADQLSSLPGCHLMVEAYRRLTDFQAQLRAARAKQRDLGAHRLLLLFESTDLNRRLVRGLGSEERRSLPVPPRRILAALAAGVDPGGDGILFLRRERAHRATKTERDRS